MGIKNGMRPVHPGEVLREDFLAHSGLTANALAKALHVPVPRINDIVRERRGVSADTALCLSSAECRIAPRSVVCGLAYERFTATDALL